MDRTAFSGYGWIVVTVIAIAIMIAFSTPFGQIIIRAVKDIIVDFPGSVESAIVDPIIDTTVSAF